MNKRRPRPRGRHYAGDRPNLDADAGFSTRDPNEAIGAISPIGSEHLESFTQAVAASDGAALRDLPARRKSRINPTETQAVGSRRRSRSALRPATSKNSLKTLGAFAGLGLLVVGSTANYQVKKGDTLSAIANKYGVSVAELASANKLPNPDLVVEGTVLVIPSKTKGSSQQNVGAHIIKAGDTLSSIAERYGFSVAELAQANSLVDPNTIFLGEVLIIPGPSPAPSSTKSANAALASAMADNLQNDGDRRLLEYFYAQLTALAQSASGTSKAQLEADSTTYTVATGDSLGGIASKFSTTIDALIKANSLSNPNLLVVGKLLKIPAAAGSASAQGGATMPEPASSTPGTTYVVATGDTLGTIALRFGVSVSAVMTANNIDNANVVSLGQQLVIPPGNADRIAVDVSKSVRAQLPEGLGSDDSKLSLVPTFKRYAAEFAVPVDLLMAMTWWESGWDNSAVSSVGAQGIGQLMPDTAEFVRRMLRDESLDSARPDDNIKMAAKFISYLLGENGQNVDNALISYYQGLRSFREEGPKPGASTYTEGIGALRSRFLAFGS